MTKTKKTKQKEIFSILQNRQIKQIVNQLELCHRRLQDLENLGSPGAWRTVESSNCSCLNFMFILAILIALIGAIVAACSGNHSACLGLSIIAVLTTALFAYFKN